jgi:hypothetical protein
VGAERWDEQVGSVADEATRLLESLRRSAAEAAASGTAGSGQGASPASPDDEAPAAPPRPDDVDPDAGTHDPDAGTHDPACQWCPLCRGAAVVRSLSPQTLTRLADLAGLAATVLAELASTRGATDGSTAGPAADAAPPAGPRSGRPIPVTDADGPREAPRA